eukprot:COSAG01_NODE_8343_length_2822_cov_4.117150_4_plen_141_part_00
MTDYTFNKDEVEDGAPRSRGRGERKDAGRGGGRQSQQGSPGGTKKMSNGAKCKALARMQKAFRQDSSQSAKTGELTHARFFAELEGSEEKGRWVVAELAMLAKLRAAAADQTPKVYDPPRSSSVPALSLPCMSSGPGCVP